MSSRHQSSSKAIEQTFSSLCLASGRTIRASRHSKNRGIRSLSSSLLTGLDAGGGGGGFGVTERAVRGGAGNAAWLVERGGGRSEGACWPSLSPRTSQSLSP